MSRSIKKHGYCTDGGKHGKGVKFAKALANRYVRRFADDIPTKGRFFRKLWQSYDIHDFIIEARPKGSEEDAYKDWRK